MLDTLPVPPASDHELFRAVARLVGLIKDQDRDIARAVAFGRPVADLVAQHARLRLNLDIMEREYLRRQAQS